MSRPISSIRAKYSNNQIGERPFFIDERSWSLFVAHVGEGKSFRDIGLAAGLSPHRVRQIIARVDSDLQMPRPSVSGGPALTLDSPIGDLKLSTLARNALGELGQRTVRDVLAYDFTRGARRMGPVTRREIVCALAAHGFGAPPGLWASEQADLAELSRHVARLREKIEVSVTQWAEQVKSLEARIGRLSRRERNGPA